MAGYSAPSLTVVGSLSVSKLPIALLPDEMNFAVIAVFPGRSTTHEVCSMTQATPYQVVPVPEVRRIVIWYDSPGMALKSATS